MKLSREKRQHLVLVALVTCMALAGLWLGLIKTQKQSIRKLATRYQAATQKLQEVKRAIQMADQIEAELHQSRKKLDELEEGMATGDLYAWTINTIRSFKLPYKVEIPQFSQIDGPRDVTLLADFPYKQANLTIGGTAKFHDFGRFVADFENQFPHIRLLNLSLEPASSLVANEAEKLSFKMEIATLIKPGTS